MAAGHGSDIYIRARWIMINPLSDIFEYSSLLSAGFLDSDYIVMIAILAAGIIFNGAYPIISSSSTEFSMNRIFIFVIFFLSPVILAFEVTTACVLAGSLLRKNESGMEFWRYLIS